MITRRSNISTHVTKIFGHGMVNPVKIFLSSSLITMKNLAAVCHT